MLYVLCDSRGSRDVVEQLRRVCIVLQMTGQGRMYYGFACS